MILFFDTEATGKANFGVSLNHPSQPRLVQLGASLRTEDNKEVATIDCIIKPDGWTIPDEAAAIHGITTGMAMERGVPVADALQVLFDMSDATSQGCVAHNLAFDSFIIDVERARLRWLHCGLIQSSCTMKAMTPVCKLPGNYGDYKWPKLQEAYRHCFGCELEGAHSALADARACAEIYFWLKERGLV